MKRWKLAAVTIMAGLFLVFTPNENRAEIGEELKYVYGTVKTISSKHISVVEYDTEFNEEVELLFQIGPNLTLENAASLNEITSGKQIHIGYVESRGKKVAVSIELDEGDDVEEGTERAEDPEYESSDTTY